MKNVLIFTAAFGEGHNTAAKNIRVALEKEGRGEVQAQVFDLYEACYPRLTKGLERGYKFAIHKAPRVWRKIYDVLDNTRLVERNLFTIRGMRVMLQKLIKQHSPVAVISTYPVYNYLLDRIYRDKRTRTFRQLTMITDAITVNSVWHRCSSDCFMVTDDITAGILQEAGVDKGLIRVTGFPVSDRFDQIDDPPLRKPLGPGVNPKVLYLIHSESIESLLAVRQLLAIDHLELTVWVGRNARLRKRIAQLIGESGRPASILGWTNRMPEMLLQHHLVIGKAGGATVQEAIAAKCPMIVSQLVPGQEEGNLRLILENDTGQLAVTASAIVQTIQDAFANGAVVWHRWHSNMDRVRKPAAARGIAQFVLEPA